MEFIMLHGLNKESKSYLFYLNKSEVKAVFPADENAAKKGYRSTVLLKGETDRAFDVTESQRTVLKRLSGTSNA